VTAYRYDPLKEAQLPPDRRCTFEAIIQAIEAGGLLRVVPNRRYPGQQIAEVLVGSYVYWVPLRANADDTVWEPITLFPNRRATKAWRTRSAR
jgi:hypothetical protein